MTNLVQLCQDALLGSASAVYLGGGLCQQTRLPRGHVPVPHQLRIYQFPHLRPKDPGESGLYAPRYTFDLALRLTSRYLLLCAVGLVGACQLTDVVLIYSVILAAIALSIAYLHVITLWQHLRQVCAAYAVHATPCLPRYVQYSRCHTGVRAPVASCIGLYLF